MAGSCTLSQNCLNRMLSNLIKLISCAQSQNCFDRMLSQIWQFLLAVLSQNCYNNLKIWSGMVAKLKCIKFPQHLGEKSSETLTFSTIELQPDHSTQSATQNDHFTDALFYFRIRKQTKRTPKQSWVRVVWLALYRFTIFMRQRLRRSRKRWIFHSYKLKIFQFQLGHSIKISIPSKK